MWVEAAENFNSGLYKVRILWYYTVRAWGIGAVGSAFEWHSKGQGFESPMLHQNPSENISFQTDFSMDPAFSKD